jgi:hypothetical protein
MATLKKKSQITILAQQRIAGLKSIAADLDLGNGLTVVDYQTAVDEVEELLSSYNTHLSLADELKNNLDSKEKILRDISERMLIGVGAKYGKDSNQYQMAGGTKKSHIRRHFKKKVVEQV